MANTTEDKLRGALYAKEGIRTAIEQQGVECGHDVPFSQYREKILAINTGSSGELIHGAVGVGGTILGFHINISGIGQFVKQDVE